jgi:hypothetical protein
MAWRFLLIFICSFVLVGCTQKIDGGTSDNYSKSVSLMMKEMTSDERGAFKEDMKDAVLAKLNLSVGEIFASAVLDADGASQQVRGALHGLSREEIHTLAVVGREKKRTAERASLQRGMDQTLENLVKARNFKAGFQAVGVEAGAAKFMPEIRDSAIEGYVDFVAPVVVSNGSNLVVNELFVNVLAQGVELTLPVLLSGSILAGGVKNAEIQGRLVFLNGDRFNPSGEFFVGSTPATIRFQGYPTKSEESVEKGEIQFLEADVAKYQRALEELGK